MKQEIDNNAMWAAFRQELAIQGELQVVAAIDNALNNLGFTIEETSTIIPIPLKQGEQILANSAKTCKDEQKPADKVEPFDKYKGLTDFERTLADICIGWIGEEYGWKQYIKDNADVLLKIAIKKFNSVQDAPFEQSPAWSDEDETGLGDALWAIQQARTIAKNENDMGNLWYAERWLKSLKDRYTWKPSDLQIKALEYYTKGGFVDKEGIFGSELVKLLEELKKL